MVHKGDMKILSHMLKNLKEQHGKVEFKAPLVVAPPTYNIVDELKAEGDWDVLQEYAGFVFDDSAPKNAARTKYDNQLYLERPGCNLCMGNQEKAEKGDTVMATSTRLFQGRVVADSAEKKGESLRLDAGRCPVDDSRSHPDHRGVQGGGQRHQAHRVCSPEQGDDHSSGQPDGAASHLQLRDRVFLTERRERADAPSRLFLAPNQW